MDKLTPEHDRRMGDWTIDKAIEEMIFVGQEAVCPVNIEGVTFSLFRGRGEMMNQGRDHSNLRILMKVTDLSGQAVFGHDIVSIDPGNKYPLGMLHAVVECINDTFARIGDYFYPFVRAGKRANNTYRAIRGVVIDRDQFPSLVSLSDD